MFKTSSSREWRVSVFKVVVGGLAGLIIAKLFFLQVIDHGFYEAMAGDQHEMFQELLPERGRIFINDLKDRKLVPVAENQLMATIYAEPSRVEKPAEAAQKIGEVLGF